MHSHGLIRESQLDALPWPLKVLWKRALQATQPDDVYAQAEGVLRVLVALLLGDSPDLPWSSLPAFKRTRWTMGERCEAFDQLSSVHAEAPNRVIAPTRAWFVHVNRDGGPLRQLVQRRNRFTHRDDLPGERRRQQEVHAVRESLAEVLRAPWLLDLQLIYVDGDVAPGDAELAGHVRRLTGMAPREEVPLRVAWPYSLAFAKDRVYLGRTDGTAWRMCFTMRVQSAVAAGDGRPRVLIMNELDSDAIVGWDADGIITRDHAEARFQPPAADGTPLAWREFLKSSREHASAWFKRWPAPPRVWQVERAFGLLDRLVPGMVIGNVCFVRELGRGGHAVVWEGLGVHSRQRHAYKFLRADEAGVPAGNVAERFEHELHVMQRLHAAGCRHVPAPVEEFRWGDDQRLVLRMPVYVESLKDRAARMSAAARARPGMAQVLRWLDACLDPLIEIHGQGVVHRDIKPSNFLLDEAGEVFLADFGIARDDVTAAAGLTSTMMPGTTAYMAPEQRVPLAEVGPPADIYALAVSIDEMWRGEVAPVPGEGVPEPLGAILRAMAAPSESARPLTRELRERVRGALRAFDAHDALDVPPKPSTEPLTSSSSAPASAPSAPSTRQASEAAPPGPTLQGSAAPAPAPASEPTLEPAPRRVALRLAFLATAVLGAAFAVRWGIATWGPDAPAGFIVRSGAGPGDAEKLGLRNGREVFRVVVGHAARAPSVQLLNRAGKIIPDAPVTCSGDDPYVRVTDTILAERPGVAVVRCADDAGRATTYEVEAVGTIDSAAIVGLRMIPVPAGRFRMGASEEAAASDAVAHDVTLTRPFLIGAHEVTQEQWAMTTGLPAEPEDFRGVSLARENYPMYGVSWCDAVAFANLASERERLAPAYALPEGFALAGC